MRYVPTKPAPGFAFITSGTTFTTVANITSGTLFKFSLQAGGGGGGAGGSTAALSGGGGGSGATGILYINGLLPNTTYAIAIGAAGVGVANTSGTTGGNTSLTIGATTYTAVGGTGGGEGSPPVGGVGGTCTGFTINIVGGQGDGCSQSSQEVGARGAESMFGHGGGAQSKGDVNNTSGYGAGGCGGWKATGGNGTQGCILVEWNT